MPVISVLICTLNRAGLLRRTLESFVTQQGLGLPFEVVVVDDGSTDDTREVVESFRGRLSLRYAFQANSGLASARNHALFLARGYLVLFQDDDDVADRLLLSEHVSMHHVHSEPWAAVLGYTDLAPEMRDDPLMHYVTEVDCQLFSYPLLEHGKSYGYQQFWGGRTSCKRSFLLEHGVFNPIFRFGCEDPELGFRLGGHGLRVVYNRKAICTTIRPITYDQFCNRVYRQGRSNAAFSLLHPVPEIRHYTGVEEAEQLWPGLEGEVEQILDRGRTLDRVARSKIASGLPLERDEVFLHLGYERAFRASRIRGTIEGLTEARPPNNNSKMSEQRRGPMNFEEYLRNIPALHTWDGGKTWNSGGFAAEHLRVFNDLVARVGGRQATVLETGAGNSTICFLYAQPARVISIAPDAELFQRILAACSAQGVDTSPLEHHVDRSEWLLPKLAETCRNGKPVIDLALIDGGHGWPTVFVDFCYVNIMVRKGGIIIIDDLQLHSIKELGRFLKKQQSSFTLVEDAGKALAFRKDTDEQFLPEWNQEPYIVERTEAYARTGEPFALFSE